MTRYWFKPKRYGYGATPVSWEGWAVTGAGLAIIVIASLLLVSDRSGVEPGNWVAFGAVVITTVALLSIISARKTDGMWRWRWGNEHE